jgi:hypothetical protein
MTLSPLGSRRSEKLHGIGSTRGAHHLPVRIVNDEMLPIEGDRTTAPEILIGAPQNGRAGAKPTDTGENKHPSVGTERTTHTHEWTASRAQNICDHCR